MDEIIPALKHRNDNELSQKVKEYEEKMNAKQKELFDLERQLGMNLDKKEHVIEEKKQVSGVLV